MPTTVVPSGTYGSGSGSSTVTVTQDTIATIEALTPSAGDMGFATNGAYCYVGLSGGTWLSTWGGHVVTRPVVGDWTLGSNNFGSTSLAEEAGALVLRVDDPGVTLTRQHAYHAAVEGNEYTFMVHQDRAEGSGTSTDYWGVGFLESATGKIVAIERVSSPDGGDLAVRGHATIDTTALTSYYEYNTTEPEILLAKHEFYKLKWASGLLTFSIGASPQGPWDNLVLDQAEATYFTTAPDRVFYFYANRNSGNDQLPVSLIDFTETAV